MQFFCNTWTVAHQAPLSMGFLRQEHGKRLSLLSPRDLPNSGWPQIKNTFKNVQFSSVQSLGCVDTSVHFVWTVALQASLSITNSRSLIKLMSIKSVMPFNDLILSLSLLPPSIFPASGSFQMSQLSHQMAKVLEFQLHHQAFQWTLRTDLL